MCIHRVLEFWYRFFPSASDNGSSSGRAHARPATIVASSRSRQVPKEAHASHDEACHNRAKPRSPILRWLILIRRPDDGQSSPRARDAVIFGNRRESVAVSESVVACYRLHRRRSHSLREGPTPDGAWRALLHIPSRSQWRVGAGWPSRRRHELCP